MFGIGPVELVIVLVIGGGFLAVLAVVLAACIKILSSGKPPDDRS